MEINNEGASKLSRTELRKQKLTEYLAAKGRLKPQNPKPYLKNSAVLGKPLGSKPDFNNSKRGKENSVPRSTLDKKDLPKGNAQAENNKHLRPCNSASSASPTLISPHLSLKPTRSETSSEQAKTQCQKTDCAARNSISTVQAKLGLHRNIIASKQDKTVKKVPKGTVSREAQPFHRSINAHPRIQTVHVKKHLVTGSEKVVHKSQVKSLTNKACQTNTVSSTGKKSLICKPATVAVKTTKINNLNKTQNCGRKPPNSDRVTDPDTSGNKQTKSQDKQELNKLGNKPVFNCTHTRLPVTAKQRSSLISTVSKSENVSKSSSTPVAGIKITAPSQKQRLTTFKPPPKPTVQAPVAHTLPRPTKAPVQLKTPKSTFNPGTDGVRTVPLDGGNKPTVAQEERLRKLKEWRESKGITYKRPPMPVQPARRKTTDVPPQRYWSTMEQEDEVQGFVCAVDQSLNDCLKLLQQGCPADQVRDVLSRVPMAQKFAKYWICRVRLLEQEGNFDVLPTFEEAIRIVREPVDELRSVVFEILKKKEAIGLSSDKENDVASDENREHCFNMCTPKPVGALIRGEKRDSSVIKYKITATPGGKRSQQRPGRVNGQEIRFFTPVRRSLRIEKTVSRYPAVLQEHDHCVTSLHDLLTESEGQSDITCIAETQSSPLYVYRENNALKEQVQIQLVYDDAR